MKTTVRQYALSYPLMNNLPSKASKMMRNASANLLPRLPTLQPASTTPKVALTRAINSQRNFSQATYGGTHARLCNRRPCVVSSFRSPHQLAFDNLVRPLSIRPLPKRRGRIFRFTYRLFAYAGGFILTTGGLVVAFFIYDASTYREDLSYTDIPVSEDALEPRRGGPKNLPIAEVLVDDDDCPENERQKHKPKLVILGSGWGSVAILKTLNPEDYHVTVVSPANYFLFTPMLPSATVGTLELRSLVEPIRRIVSRVKGHFLKAEAVDVELSEKLLEVMQTNTKGEECHFYLPYDKLVLGVGM